MAIAPGDVSDGVLGAVQRSCFYIKITIEQLKAGYIGSHTGDVDGGPGSQRHAIVTCAGNPVPIKDLVGGHAVDGHSAAILNDIIAGGLHMNIHDVGLSALKFFIGSHFGPGIIHGTAVVPGDLIHGVGTAAHRDIIDFHIRCLTALGVGDRNRGRVDEHGTALYNLNQTCLFVREN